MAERFAEEQRSTFLSREWYGLSEAERMARWTHRPPFWGEPLRNHGLDLATATFPDLLYRRLDQLGIDFTVLYPTIGINPQGYADEATSARLLSRPQRLLRRPLDGSPRPHDARSRSSRCSRRRRRSRSSTTRSPRRGFKAVMLPSYVKRPLEADRRARARGGPFRVAGRHVRHRQRARLRPGVGEVSRPRRRAELPRPRRRAPRSTTRSPTPSTTTSGTSRARRPRSASRSSSAA